MKFKPNPIKLVKLGLLFYTIGLVAAFGYTALTASDTFSGDVEIVQAADLAGNWCTIGDSNQCQQRSNPAENTGWVCHCEPYNVYTGAGVWRCDQYNESACPKQTTPPTNTCTARNYVSTGSCGTGGCAGNQRPIYKTDGTKNGDGSCKVTVQTCSNDNSCVTTPPNNGNECENNNDCTNGKVCQGANGSKKCQTPIDPNSCEGQNAVCGGNNGYIGFKCNYLTNGQCLEGDPGYISHSYFNSWQAATNYAGTCGQADTIWVGGNNQCNGKLCGQFSIFESSCNDTTTEVGQCDNPTWCASFQCPHGDTHNKDGLPIPDGECTVQDSGASMIAQQAGTSCPVPSCGQKDLFSGPLGDYSGGNWCSATMSQGWPNCGTPVVTTTCYQCTASLTDGNDCRSRVVDGTSCPAGWTTNSACQNGQPNNQCPTDTSTNITCYTCTADLGDGNTCEPFQHTGSSCPAGSTTSSACETAEANNQCPVDNQVPELDIDLASTCSSITISNLISAANEFNDASYYVISHKLSGEANSAYINSPHILLNQNSYTIAGLEEDSTYTIRIRLYNSNGERIARVIDNISTNLCAFCGDGILQTNLGEQCDDGNTTNGDGCSDQCLNENINNNLVLSSRATCDAVTASWNYLNGINPAEVEIVVDLYGSASYTSPIATSGVLSGSSTSYQFNNLTEDTTYYIRVTLSRPGFADEYYYTSVYNPVCNNNDLANLEISKQVLDVESTTWVEETTVTKNDNSDEEVQFRVVISNPEATSNVSINTLQFIDRYDRQYIDLTRATVILVHNDVNNTRETRALNNSNFNFTDQNGVLRITNLLAPFGTELAPGERIIIRMWFDAVNTTYTDSNNTQLGDTQNIGEVNGWYAGSVDPVNRDDDAFVRIREEVPAVPVLKVNKSVDNRLYYANNDTAEFTVRIRNLSQNDTIVFDEILFTDEFDTDHLEFIGGTGRRSDNTITNVDLGGLFTVNAGVIQEIDLADTFGALSNGESIILKMQFNVLNETNGDLANNLAIVNATTDDGDILSDSDDAEIIIIDANELALVDVNKYEADDTFEAIDDSDKFYNIDDTIYFRVDVENIGNVTLDEIAFLDEFDQNAIRFEDAYVYENGNLVALENVDVTQSGEIYVSNLADQLGDLAPGEVIMIALEFTALEPGNTTNNAIIYVDNSSFRDDEDVTIVDPNSPGVSIDKHLAPGYSNSFEIGDTMEFEIQVINTGNTVFNEAYFNDTFDTDYLEFLSTGSATSLGGTVTNRVDFKAESVTLTNLNLDLSDLSNGTIVIEDLISLFNESDFEPGEVITIYLSFEALESTDSLPNNVTINTALVETTETDTDIQRVIIESDVPEENIEFEINKTDSGDGVYGFDETVEFVITIENLGDSVDELRFKDTFDNLYITPDLSSATLSIDRGPAVVFNDLSSIANIVGGNKITIANLADNSLFGTIDSGEIITIVIPFQTLNQAGITENEAEIFHRDLNFTDDEIILIEDGSEAPELTLNKNVRTHSDNVFRVSETIEYDIRILNSGNISISDIEFRDKYSASKLRLLSAELVKYSASNVEQGRINNIIPLAFVNTDGLFTINNIASTSLGGLAPGEYFMVNFKFMAEAPGTTTNYVRTVLRSNDNPSQVDEDTVVITIENLDTDI
ncbi:MAG: hypothetical protein Q9M91_02805 [Candidatus Dojkabacteria bacterium]|nr:hypothetical protein [Candidatus Dojkabacteria bacterium]MDQ7020754.1 hypothetical protein [Candidatus Dojkabacteria bacterium]